MTTSILTREEAHARVDALFDEIEEAYDGPAVMVIGGISGESSETYAPSESSDLHRFQGQLGWGDFFKSHMRFSRDAVMTDPCNDMLGTLIVPESFMEEDVQERLAEIREEHNE